MDKGLNFRHLIKTFVPGLFTFLSIYMILDLIILKIAGPETESSMWTFISNNNVLVVSLIIPASLFTGIVINTICFIQLIPLIKRRQTKSTQKEDLAYYKYSQYLFEEMRKNYKSQLFPDSTEVDDKDFADFFDVKSFLLHEQDMTRLQYIKTGYWYYLEFQLNSILTIAIALISLNLNIFLRDIHGIELCQGITILLLSVILGTALVLLLYKAIIKNLKKDRKIELSYILGAYHKNSYQERLKN